MHEDPRTGRAFQAEGTARAEEALGQEQAGQFEELLERTGLLGEGPAGLAGGDSMGT